MIPAELRRALASLGGGVFYLHGEDELGKDAAVRAVVDAYCDSGTREFNLDVLRGGDVDVETLASVLGTPPMMADWRVVILRETQALSGTPRARAVVLEAVTRPPPGLVLILVATEPAGSTARFYRDLAKASRAFEFRTPSEHDLPGWIMAWARDVHGIEMAEDAARGLAQAVGVQVPTLARELEKFASMVDEGGMITLEVVESAGIRLPRQDRWKWLDLVGMRRFPEALAGLAVLLDQGESGVGLTIALGTHFLRLGIVVDAGPAALAATLPPHQRFLAQRYRDQAEHWSPGEVERALRGLRQADRALKSSPMPEEHVMESWLLKQMASAGAAA